MERQEKFRAWFGSRVPEEWFAEGVAVDVDPDEIFVVGTLPAAPAEGGEGDPAPSGEAAAHAFRESTREKRIYIAEEAERTFRRKVSWGVKTGEETYLFTHLTVPVMTRLRMTERRLLDTLIEGGVARSRSEALAWCVRLVSRNESEWLADLREALKHVQAVRAEAPKVV